MHKPDDTVRSWRAGGVSPLFPKHQGAYVPRSPQPDRTVLASVCLRPMPAATRLDCGSVPSKDHFHAAWRFVLTFLVSSVNNGGKEYDCNTAVQRAKNLEKRSFPPGARI
jgi:hypothetical protein